LQDRAIEDLRRVGADIRPIGSEDFMLDPGGIKAVLDSRYTGKSSDMELLKQITNLQWLQIVNVPLDQEALATIGQLPGLARLDLYGTGVSSQMVEELARKLPAGARIDRRGGALLGVKGSSGQLSCIIEEVQPGRAASDAGLLDHDEIITFDGQPVRNFEELTALVSAKKGGEQVQLEIRRDGQTLTKPVTLGKWR
jgi:C-terminal processing protease CtpA/Prc